MKKLLAASLILVAIVCFAFQNKDSKSKTDTPSVSRQSEAIILSDTADLDEQMKKLEAEMKVHELRMKPFEEEMKKLEKDLKLVETQMKKMEDKDGFDKNMEKFQKQMEVLSDKMSQVGDKMGAVGDDMGKIGDKMGVIGDKMGERHERIFSWFLNELKKDGLLKEGKCRIVIDENLFVVNEKTLTAAEAQKYKKGIETRLGKPLKADFSIFMKGDLKDLKENSYNFDGTMNTNY